MAKLELGSGQAIMARTGRRGRGRCVDQPETGLEAGSAGATMNQEVCPEDRKL